MHYCGRCDELIHDGSERTWTGRYDAPIGQFRRATDEPLRNTTIAVFAASAKHI